MSGVRDDQGIVHVPSDGYEDGLGKNNGDPWYALCEVVDEAQPVGRPFTFVKKAWNEADVVNEKVNCMACIAVVKEALKE